jgi:polyhydroxyalkanoate synthase subunit PhaC
MSQANPLEMASVEFERMLQRGTKGLAYLTTPPPLLGISPKTTVLSKGTMQLYHYRQTNDEVYRVPVLLVMATTNRGYIFDMVPGQSFVEFLINHGYDVFMLDWNAPRVDEKNLGIDDYVFDFLPSAIAKVGEISGEPDVSIVGYCFGGVLSLLWAALNPEGPMKNLATFTTPVNFKAMEMFQAWSDQRFFDVDRLTDTFGNCPAEILYSAFDMLRPGGRIAGNVRLWDNMWDDEFVNSHRMFDRWATDMLPLAGRYFRETTKQLMWDNALYEGSMEIAGRKVDLSAITAPFFHAVAEHDHIVPYAASQPLIDMISSVDKQEVVLKGGHVSLIAGGNAVRRLWPQIDLWLRDRSL